MTNKLSTMLITSLPHPRPGARSGIRWILPALILPALILLLVLAAALGSGSAAAQSSDPSPVPAIGWVKIVGPSEPVMEGETAVFTVTRQNTNQELTIPYQVSELRGENNNTVNSQSGDVTFAPREAVKTIWVTLDDNVVEKNNQIKVELFVLPICGGLFPVPCIGNLSATVQIQDDDKYGLSIDSPSVDEGRQGATELTFTARLSNPTDFPVEVDYTVSDSSTATAGPNYTDADYRDQLTIDGDRVPLQGAFTFLPGQTQKRITVTVNGDAEIEEDETVVVEVELANEDDQALALPNGRAATGTGTIRNDDNPIDGISIAGPTQPVPEGQTAEFTVTRDNTSRPRQLTYSVCAIRGASDRPTPSAADCYHHDLGGNVSFALGQDEETIRVPTSGDYYVEQHDRVRVTLFIPGHTSSLLATARIQGRDRYSLHVDTPSVDEGDSGAADLTFNVDLDRPADFPVEVDYRVSDRGTADAGDDYVNQQGTVTFAPGETEKQVTVTVNGDTDFEADETVVVDVELANDDDRAYAAPGGDAASGAGTIRNDDHYIISFREGSDGYENVAGSNAPVPVQFKVTLTPAAPGTVTVDYETFDPPGSRPLLATSGADFRPTSGALTFAPGDTEKTVAVTVLDDDLAENKEEVWLRLSNAQGFAVKIQPAAEGPDGTKFQYIHSDEGYGHLISVQNDGPDILTEPASGATASLSFVVNLSAAAPGPVKVNYRTVDGTASSGGAANAGEDDYEPARGTLTFEAGAVSKTIDVTVNGDDAFEGETPESLWLLLSNPRGPSGTNVGFEVDNLGFEKRSFLGLIADNPPHLKLTVDAPTALESDVGGTPLLPFFFTLRMNQPQQEEVTVRVGSGGTAIGTGGAPDRTTDYIRPALGNVTFKPGETEKELRFYVLPDNRVEDDETVEITVTAPPIFNPDGDDDVVIVATGTILNNDHQVWANWPKVTEGAAGETTPLTFKVTLRPPVSSGEVTVNYRTADRTYGHTADQNDIDADWIGSNDYEAKSGTLTFPANTGRQEIEVTVNGDDFDEHDEYFILELSGLSGPEGIRLEFPPGSKGNYRGTIKDDDDFAYRVPTEANTRSVPEGAWRMLIDGRRSYQTFVRLDIWTNRQWYSENATCNAGEGGTAVGAAIGRDHGDYYQSVPSPGVPGGTNVHSTFISHAYSGGPVDWTDDFGETGYQNSVWCHLPIWGDPFVEDDETVVVEYQHSAVGHGADNPITLGTITILNDDHALSVDSPSVDEGDTGTAELVFTVTLDPPSTGTVTVDYATSDGSAEAGGSANAGGDDYEPKSGTLTFEAGETTQTVTVIVNGDETYEGELTQDETVLLEFSNPSGPGFSTIKLPGEPAGGTLQPADPAYVEPDPIDHPSGTIRHDDPFPKASIGAPAAPVVEGGDLVFPVTLSDAYHETWRVRYQLLSDSSATRGEDYTAEGYDENAWGIVELAPGQTKASITLKTTDDMVVEDEETVRVQLSAPTETPHFEVDQSKNTATGAITDNDRTLVTVASDGDVTEGENAVFTLTRTRDTSSEIMVTFAVTGGNAVLTNAAPTSATIPANATTATVSLATTDDNTDEPNATLTLTLADGDAYDLGSNSAATLTVQDNDGAPALTVADAAAAEDADLTFAISLSPASSGTVTVSYAITPDTAQAADYTGTTSGTLTFAPGETSQSVTLDVVDDTVDEPEETVTLTLSNQTGTASIEDATATGAITDNDLPSVTVASGGNVTEGADAEFTLTRASQDTGAALEVTFSVTGGDAALSGDAPTAATIPANATTVTVSLATEDDNTDEPNATLTLTLDDGAAYDLGSDRAATLTVQDNDGAPAISVADAAASEDADLVFELTLNPAGSQEVTVDYAITADTAQAADYTGTTSGSVTFAPGETSKDVTLDLVDDTADEPEETVTLALSNLTGTASIGNAAATGAITDNDSPVVTVASGGDITEGANAEFTLTRASEDIDQQLLVNFAVTGGDTVLSDEDDAPVSAAIPANATTVTVSIPTEDDETEEDDATLTLTLTDGDAYDLGSNSAATLTVEDNDTPEVGDLVVSVAPVKSTITEGDDAAFALTRSGGPSGELTVTFTVTDSGSVLSGNAPTSVTFGEDQATAPVILATDDDETDEPNATLTLTLTDGSGYDLSSVSSQNSASVTVEDNDARPHADAVVPKVTVAAVDDTVTEGNDAVFRLTRTGDSTLALPVTFSVSDPGSALSASAPTSATIPANATTALVALATADDNIIEPNSTITLTLTDGDAYDLGSDRTATLTVQDNDSPVVTVSSDGDVTEGANAEFTLTRASEDTGAALEVTFSVTGGDAALSADPPTSATIPANATTVTVSLATEDDNTDEPDATLTLTLTDGAAYDLGSDRAATLTVQDNDGTPALSAADAAASEDADLVFEVTLDPASSGTVTVNYAITADTAQAADYTGATSGTVTFAPGETSQDVTLALVDDATDEPEETVTLTLSGLTGTASIADGTATGTITDNDGPVVTVSSGGDVTEGSDAEFTLTRASENTGAALSVTFTVSDPGSALSDAATTSATIPADATTVTVSLATEDDNIDEPDATLTLTLTDGAAYDLGSDRAATLTVADNDGTPALSAADAAASEDADLVFEVTLDPASSGTVTVNYAITADTAQAADYTGATSGSVTFAPGDTVKEVTLDLVDDTTDEPEETVTLTLSSIIGTASIADGTATGTITDNDGPVVTVSSDGDVTEGADAEFTLTRASQDTGAALEVTFTVTGGDAALSDEAPTSATIPADATTVTVSLATEDDNTDEPDATLTLTLSDGAAYDLGSDRAATLTVADNDGTPALSAADAAASEDADLVFEITLDPASSGTVTVNYAITADTAQAADYTGATSGSVTFAPGDTVKKVTLALVDDAVDEPEETVTLTLSGLTGTASIADGTATGTITDNDGPVVTVSSGGDVTEGADAEFTLTRASQDTGAALEVTFSVTGGDAVLSDAAPTSATIPADATTVTVALATEDDNTDEPDATLTLTLTDGAAYDLGSDRAATLTVADNDGTPALSAADAAASEDADLVFELTLDPASSGTVTVNYAITADTAQAADYTGATSGTVTFAPGETSQDVTLALVDDTVDEPEETVTLTLAGLTGTASIADGTATGTITDNDLPVVTVTSGGDVTEGADAEFTLTRASADTGAVLSVTFTVSDPGSALSDAAPTSATIPANATTVTVSLATEDDNTDEPDATLTLTLTDGAAYDLGSDNAATLTVQDNDGTPALSAADAAASEDADLVFELTLNPASSGTVTVNYAITADTAQAADYTGATSGSVTFAPGDTVKEVTLDLVDDTTDEPEETVTLTLSSIIGTASIADGTATGTITDNDGPVVTVSSDGDVTEGADAEFTLTRASQDTGAALEVTFTVTGGDAALSDEAPTSATIPADATTVTVSLATEDDNTDEPDATLTLTLSDGAAYDLGSDRAATLTVADNDGTPALSAADAAASEDADLVFEITLDPASSGTVTVNYAITADTAQAADYTGATSGSVTFAPGDTVKKVTLALVDDAVDEPEETVTLTLSGLTGTASIADGTATGTITDNDGPVVTVSSGGDVTEGADAEFTLTRASQDTGAALEVTFSVTGGDAVLSDAAPTSATIPADATTVTVALATEDDNTDEPDATLTLTLTDGAAYDLGSARAATLTVADNDGTPALSAADAAASEDADLVFELTLDPASSGTVQVNYAITADTAQAADYTGATSGTVTFAPGDTSQDVTLNLVDDTTDEPEETVTLTLSGLTGTASIADGTATGTITDNDGPVVTVSSDGDVTEGADAEFTLTRASQDTGAALEVTFSVTGGDAVLSGDAPTSATIPANATTVTVSLATEDDNIDEPDATLTLTLSDGAAYDLGSDRAATLTVADNDGTPALSAADAAASEDADLVFEITLDPASSGTVQVNYAITADTAQAADYTGTTSGSVTFAPGDTSQDVTLDLVDDGVDEPEETVTLTLSGLTGTASIADGTATGTITDNDGPVVTVSSGGDVTEGANAEFTLTRASQDTGAALEVTFSVTGGDAVLSDAAPTAATIPANATTVTVSLATEDDNTDEPDATLTLTLTDGASYDLGSDNAATLTVADNDGTPALSAADAAASEDADLVFEITLNPASSQEVTVDYAITADTAQAADYTGATSGTVTFAPGETSQDVTLNLVDDTTDEPEETVTLTLSGLTGTASIADGTATGTITDNDGPVVTVSSGGDVTEGADAEFTLTRASENTGAALSVTFTVTGGDAVLSDDAPTAATIPANATTVKVSLATEDDNIDEPDATLTLTLTDGAAYDLGSDRAATLTVQDNDGAPALSAADASASEDADLVFELTLDPASSGTVTVNYAITADTAQAADYTGATSGSVTFTPGETSQDVTLDLVDDAADEPEETVTLTLSGLTGTASIADGTATGTITDNDGPVVTVASGGDVTEGSDAEFTLTRASQDTGAALSVTFSVTGGDAVLSDDAPTAATIPANATTVTVSLATEDDNTDEPDATLTLTLTDGAAYDLGSDRAATLTVADNDGTPALTAADAAASEDADLVFELTLNPASSGTVSVNYAITADTAQAADYTGTTSGSVTFAPGDTVKEVTLALVDDTTDEPEETVTLTLSGLTGTASIADGTATGTITDNDGPVVTVSSDGDVTEGADAEFTLTRASEDTGAALPVTFTVTGGDAVLSDAAPTSATIPANATTVTVSLATEDDNTDEPDATLTLTLTDGAAYDLGSDRAATLTVADNDGAPEDTDNAGTPEDTDNAIPIVTVVSATATAGGEVVFTLMRTGDLSVPLVIRYQTVFRGQGLSLREGYLTFLEGSSTLEMRVPEFVEGVVTESDRTAELTLLPPNDHAQGYVVGDPSEARLRVAGTPRPALSAADASASEDADLTFKITLHPASSQEVTVDYAIRPDTAQTTDYTGATSGSVTFAPSETSKSVTLDLVDDDVAEPDETVTLTLTLPDRHEDESLSPGFYHVGTARIDDATATGTITDDDPPVETPVSNERPVVTVASGSDVTEGENAEFTLTRDGATNEALFVTFSVTGGDAALSHDAPTSATIPANATTVTVSLATEDDNIDEPDATLTLTLADGEAYDLGSDRAATLTVQDNDGTPELTAADASASEDADLVFEITLNPASSQEVAVDYEITPDTAQAADYTGTTSGAVTFAPGETSKDVTLGLVDDTVDEPDETVTLTLSGLTGTASIADGAAMGTITDNDLPSVTVSSGGDVTEGESAEFTLTRASQDTGAALLVNFTVTGGDAVLSSNAPTAATIPANATTVTVSLATEDDNTDEPDATLTLTLTDGAAYDLGSDRSATLTVQDNDDAPDDNDLPVVTVTSGGNVTEGADAEFTLTRASEDTGAALTVTFSVTGGGTALINDAPTSATIPADATTVKVSLATEDDNTDEPDATLTLTLTDGDAYDLGTPSVATVTVEDNDDTPTLTVADASASEDADLVFALTLHPASSQEVTVDYEITPDTAQAADYAGATSGSVTFAPGETSKGITLDLVDDEAAEPDETVTLTLANLTGPANFGDGAATGTITDNDQQVVTVESATETENGEVVFTLRRRGNLSIALTIGYQVVYRGQGVTLREGYRTFPEGSSTLEMRDPEFVDGIVTEADRTVELTLLPPDDYASGYVVGDPSEATLRVAGTPRPALSVADAAASEDADLVFALTLSPASELSITVDYAIAPGTAQAADYTGATSGTVTFAPGDTSKNVTLDVVDDDIAEPDETVTLTLTLPDRHEDEPLSNGFYHVGTARIDDAIATGTITDNDLPVVAVATEAGAVTEGEDAVFVFSRTGDASSPLTVTVAVGETGSVLAVAPPTTAAFGANETETRLRVATVDDSTEEPDGRVTVTVRLGDGYTVAPDAGSAGVDVLDNDGSSPSQADG